MATARSARATGSWSRVRTRRGSSMRSGSALSLPRGATSVSSRAEIARRHAPGRSISVQTHSSRRRRSEVGRQRARPDLRCQWITLVGAWTRRQRMMFKRSIRFGSGGQKRREGLFYSAARRQHHIYCSAFHIYLFAAQGVFACSSMLSTRCIVSGARVTSAAF